MWCGVRRLDAIYTFSLLLYSAAVSLCFCFCFSHTQHDYSTSSTVGPSYANFALCTGKIKVFARSFKQPKRRQLRSSNEGWMIEYALVKWSRRSWAWSPCFFSLLGSRAKSWLDQLEGAVQTKHFWRSDNTRFRKRAVIHKGCLLALGNVNAGEESVASMQVANWRRSEILSRQTGSHTNKVFISCIG